MALLLALIAGVLLLGCGSSDTDHRGSASSEAGTTTFKPIVQETHADIVAAVTACRQGVNVATWLSQANKQELYNTCNKALVRGLTEVIQYGLEVCTEVTYTSPAKSAQEKAHVFSACYAGTKLRTTVAGS